MISVINSSNVFDQDGMLRKGNEYLRAETIFYEITEYIESHDEFTAWEIRNHVIRKYGDWSKTYLSDLGLYLAKLERFEKIERAGKRDAWILYTKVVRRELP